MEPGLGDSAWDVLKFCLVWALVWLGLAWLGGAPRLRHPQNLPGLGPGLAWFGPGFA